MNADRPFDHVATGGQPSVEHLESLASADCSAVLDLRDPMEPRDFDEPTVVKQLGMKYACHPVSGATMNDDTLDRVREAITALEDGEVFVHCGSGGRVGAALIPHMVLDLGQDEETAVTAAMRMGLRSAELLEWALDYTHRKAAEYSD